MNSLRRTAIFVCFVLAVNSHLVLLAQFEPRPLLTPQVNLEEATQTSLAQLQRADKFASEMQFADALESLRRVIDQSGTQLIAVPSKSAPKGFTTYVPVREEVQRLLCQLAPEALRLYRNQVDGEATTLLEQARRERSEQFLQRLVEQYLASSVGDDAALLLGDAALARGDVVAARRAWYKLHPALRTSDAAADELGIYPAIDWYPAFRGKSLDTDQPNVRENFLLSSASPLAAHPTANASLADIRARLILASILEGNVARAKWELRLFQAYHGDQQGKLVGRSGAYVDLLDPLLKQAESSPDKRPHREWGTFGGSPERNAVAAMQSHKVDQVRWSVELPRVKSDRDVIGTGRLRVAEHHEAVLSYHPVIHDGLVMVFDGQSLRAIDVSSGKVSWEVWLREEVTPAITQRQVGVPRYTLTVAEGVAAVTLPTAVVPAARAPTIRREELSRVIAVDLETRKRVFEVVADNATEIFEGSPLIHAGRVFVASRRQAEIRPQYFVVCYDLASGRLLWEQQVCAADSLAQGNLAEYAGSLLTLSHNTLYAVTNLGVVAALKTDDGSLRWVTRYPRAEFPAQKPERSDRHFFRDLNPAVVHQGYVLCAPADSDRIFALDATSGQLIWTLPPGDAADAIHLLGVNEGHLLASGDYLYWINVVTGQVAAQFPSALPTGPGLSLPSPRGWGRGILAGTDVFWPTETAIYLFRQRPKLRGSFYEPDLVGRIDLAPLKTAGGNVNIAEDQVFIASGDKLIAIGAKREGDR